MSTGREIQVTVRAAHATLLEEAVASGEYGSIADAFADALDTWARRHLDRAEALAEVRAMVGASINDPTPSLSLAEVDAHLEAFFRNVEKSRADEAA